MKTYLPSLDDIPGITNGNGKYPGSNGGFPGNNGGFPNGNTGYPWNNNGHQGNNGGFPGNNGGFPNGNTGYPWNNNGYPGSNNGFLEITVDLQTATQVIRGTTMEGCKAITEAFPITINGGFSGTGRPFPGSSGGFSGSNGGFQGGNQLVPGNNGGFPGSTGGNGGFQGGNGGFQRRQWGKFWKQRPFFPAEGSKDSTEAFPVNQGGNQVSSGGFPGSNGFQGPTYPSNGNSFLDWPMDFA
ncbi:hypothetical protein OSTOST_20748 [Ostertagia ostertagi]